MPSYVTPKINTEFIMYLSLESASTSGFQSNPTLATGDVQVSTDGGALANISTLPTVEPAGSSMVKLTLSASEMNGDNVTVVFSDAAGDEWKDVTINIQTSAQQIDDLATQASVDTIDGIVDNILLDTAEIGTAGAGLTAIPWNSAWDAEVQSECADALTAYDPPTKAELDSGLAGLNDPTAAAIADAVWDESTTGHTTAGTFGEQVKTDIDAILADTNELQTDDVPGLISGLNDLSAAQVNAEVDTALADIGLDHLIANSSVDADVANNSIIAKLAASGSPANFSDYDSDTDSLQAIRDHIGDGTNLTEAGGTGDHLTAVPYNSAWDAEIQSEVTDALNAYDPPTKAELDAGLAGLNDPTAAAIADAVWDEDATGHQTAGTFGEALGDPAATGNSIRDLVANVQTTADAIETDTQDLQTQIGTAGAGLTAIPWNSAWDAEVQSECTDALNAYDPPTKTEMDAGFAALNDLSAADVNAEVDTALADIHLDHLLAVNYDPASKPGVATALLNEIIENDGGVSRFTANALEQAPSGGGGGNDWTSGEKEQIRSALGVDGTKTAATGGQLQTIDSNVDAVLLDTAEIGTAGAGLSAIPWNAAWDAEVQSECTDALTAYDPPTKAEMDAGFAALNDFDPSSQTVTLDTGQIAIKKNTALANFEFLMTDSTNHAPATGLTVSATRSIDGGAFAAAANAVSELSNGVYVIDLAASDLNGDVITLRFTASGADDRVLTIMTQA